MKFLPILSIVWNNKNTTAFVSVAIGKRKLVDQKISLPAWQIMVCVIPLIMEKMVCLSDQWKKQVRTAHYTFFYFMNLHLHTKIDLCDWGCSCFFLTGVLGGLRLQLNIEMYEYMAGPNPGTGIKILLHDPKETPLLWDMGIAVAPGLVAYIGIRLSQVSTYYQVKVIYWKIVN